METREEYLIRQLVEQGDVNEFEARTRVEAFLKNACLKCGCEGLPAPRTRVEALLYKLNEELTKGGGGGGSSQDSGGKYLVRVVDYDGTILKQDHLDSGSVFELPEAPTHDRLVFQEWVGNVDIVDNKVTIVDNDIIMGPIYTTVSGLCEFDIELTKVTGLTFTLYMEGVKDWGDGTSDELTSHTYSNYGKYTIKANGTISTPSNTYLFGNTSSVANHMLVKAHITNRSGLSQRTFCKCETLKYVTLSNTIQNFNGGLFNNCLNLKTIILPNHYNLTSGYDFQGCQALVNVVFGKNITTIGYSSLSSCYSLREIALPDSVTKIESDGFSSAYFIEKIIIPRNLTTMSSCFKYIRAASVYDFSRVTKVPTITSTNAFNGINSLCKIYVPDDLYDSFIVATNWSTYADYIYKASEMED